MSDVRYFNFPVALLQDFMTDSQSVLKNILYYSVYAHSAKLTYGDEVYRIRQTLVHYGLRANLLQDVATTGRQLFADIPKASPMAGINMKLYLEFRYNEKKEFDKICLLGFLALKSIIGKKPYCKVDNKFWLSRMDGSAKSKDTASLSAPISSYSSEYMTKKIKNELKQYWGLKSYSRYTRGFYVSFDMKFEALVTEVEMKRKGTKAKQQRDAEKEIVSKVLEKLHTPKELPLTNMGTPSIRKIGGISVQQAKQLLSR